VFLGLLKMDVICCKNTYHENPPLAIDRLLLITPKIICMYRQSHGQAADPEKHRIMNTKANTIRFVLYVAKILAYLMD
jgi:hypothetical protein